jgi:hypothetical protein
MVERYHLTGLPGLLCPWRKSSSLQSHNLGEIMKNSTLTALLVGLLSSVTMSAPNYVVAADCCPGSGCCATGQTYVGQQLFPNPAIPFQVNAAPAATPSQPVRATSMTSSAEKRRSPQTNVRPTAPMALQAAWRFQDTQSASAAALFGTLW